MMGTWWTATLLLLSAVPAVLGVVNVALNKQASMSSRYGSISLPPGGAVDGNITTVWPDIISTDLDWDFAWWMVDLQGEVQGATVEIYFRTDYTKRRNGTELYTSAFPFKSSPGGKLCHIFHGTNIPDVVNTTCPGKWRYLMVYTNTLDFNGALLQIGEVIILGCLNGTYGPQCNKSCEERHCINSSSLCDPVSGRCEQDCQSGWSGTDCMEACSNGTYGMYCTSRCGNCAAEDTCNHINGSCPQGCRSGWRLDLCQEVCLFDTYGLNCNSSCGNCAVGDTCNHVDGTCPGGCQAGWQASLCQEKCLPGSYGPGCQSLCRRCVGNMSCDHVSGNCEDGYEEESELVPCSQNDGHPCTFIPYVIGGVIGATVMLVIGLLICLVRFVRSRWIAVKATKSAESSTRPSHESIPGVVSHTVAETPNPAVVSTNDYAGLDPSDDQLYDVIQNHDYENNQ